MQVTLLGGGKRRRGRRRGKRGRRERRGKGGEEGEEEEEGEGCDSCITKNIFCHLSLIGHLLRWVYVLLHKGLQLQQNVSCFL